MTAFAGKQFLHRRGDTDPVFLAPASADVIEQGDLLFLDPDTSTPRVASSMGDQGSLRLNQDVFQEYFLGVALQASRSGDTDKIAIATLGEFEFDIASGTWTVGDLMGAAEQSSGTALENQKVGTAARATLAIGRAAETIGTAATKILVRIKSTIMHSGVAAQEAGSSSAAV